MKELKEFSLKEEYVPRSILYIVVHCSATRANIPFTEEQLLQCHLSKHPIKYPFSLLYFHCTFAFAILHELLTYFHYDTRTI